MSANLTNTRASFMTPHMRDKVLLTLQMYLEGLTWRKIAEAGGYSWSKFSRMMIEYPDLGQAYQTARKSSGHSMEDKALELASELTGPNEFTGTQVQAHKAAMEQYRWSASRRNPTEYAEAGAKQVSVVVPIQINSSLDLADGKGSAEEAPKSIWEVHAEVLEAGPTASESEEEVEDDLQLAESSPEASPESLEALAERLGVPEKLQSAVSKRPSPGRPRKKHMDRRKTSIVRTKRLRSAVKNPTVARALGLETTNELAEFAGPEPADPEPVSGAPERQRRSAGLDAEPTGDD